MPVDKRRGAKDQAEEGRNEEADEGAIQRLDARFRKEVAKGGDGEDEEAGPQGSVEVGCGQEGGERGPALGDVGDLVGGPKKRGKVSPFRSY